MNTDVPALFAPLLPLAPLSVQQFLHAALKLSDLQNLYTEARGIPGLAFSPAALQILGVTMSIDPADLARIPSTGPVLVVANHPFGLLDGLLLDALLSQVRPDFRILTNSVLSGVKELQHHMIPIDVFGSGESAHTNLRAIRQAMDWLEAGHCVATFPAGEVSIGQAAKSVSPIAPGPNFPPAAHPSPADATSYLRARTYALRHRETIGEKARRVNAARVSASPSAVQTESNRSPLLREIACLSAAPPVVESDTFAVYSAPGAAIRAVLREIGRLREVTFRAVGEGTGRALDLDRFDTHYTHLILWHKQAQAIAGAYRLAWTADVLPHHGVRGLYTSTLFRYSPQFFAKLGSAVELGRSFVCGPYQKSFAPLLLLWQAIARQVAARPEAPVLFGPVSISAEYSAASREIMVQFLKEQRYRSDLAPFLKPRQPFRSKLTREAELITIARSLRDIDQLAGPLRDLDSEPGVPVLLRQYLKLSGRVAGFNVDPHFSDALDGLLVVDLREAAPRLLARYMGAQTAAAFALTLPPARPVVCVAPRAYPSAPTGSPTPARSASPESNWPA